MTERKLRPYKGNPVPPPLKLTDLDGKVHDLADYKGQSRTGEFLGLVVPAVRERNALDAAAERKMAGKPFVILAVNMAEPENEVRDFLATKVKVDFPILMDRDGAALKAWKVFVFPTSFVIGPDGMIAYGLYGELSGIRTKLSVCDGRTCAKGIAKGHAFHEVARNWVFPLCKSPNG